MIRAILTKPLDGQPEGTEREFDKVDFERLKALGALRAAPQKAAPPVANKMAIDPANKAAADAARVAADADIATIDAAVKAAREAGDAEIATISANVAAARGTAEAQMADIDKTVAEHLATAEQRIKEIDDELQARREALKGEPAPENKLETAPGNKADGRAAQSKAAGESEKR